MLSSLLLLSLAVVAPLARANVYVTNPIAASSLPAGQPVSITWQDDNKVPLLASFGPASIGLYAGNQQQQTLLQMIATNVDVSKISTQSWTPSASVGPNFNSYFIRFTSNNLSDPTQAQFKAEAFSAKFALTGMTGTFNATVQAEINGTVSSTTAAATTPTANTIATPATVAKATTTATNGSSTANSKTSSGAGHIAVPGILTATGVAAITFAFFL
jgi:hypothetical protein